MFGSPAYDFRNSLPLIIQRQKCLIPVSTEKKSEEVFSRSIKWSQLYKKTKELRFFKEFAAQQHRRISENPQREKTTGIITHISDINLSQDRGGKGAYPTPPSKQISKTTLWLTRNKGEIHIPWRSVTYILNGGARRWGSCRRRKKRENRASSGRLNTP